jgi:hypothetical protein
MTYDSNIKSNINGNQSENIKDIYFYGILNFKLSKDPIILIINH